MKERYLVKALHVDQRTILERGPKEVGWEGLEVGCCEHGNEPLGSRKYGEFCD
jgi:hypothetical protein